MSLILRVNFYADAFKAAYSYAGEPEFRLVVVEKVEPYAVAVYRVPEDAIHAGRLEYTELLDRLKLCRERNEWPGIANDTETDLIMPPWAFGPAKAQEIFIDGEAFNG